MWQAQVQLGEASKRNLSPLQEAQLGNHRVCGEEESLPLFTKDIQEILIHRRNGLVCITRLVDHMRFPVNSVGGSRKNET